MTKKRILKLSLLFGLGILPSQVNWCADPFKTPEKKRKTLKRTREEFEQDSPYIPELTPESAQKRKSIIPNLITERTVYNWPSVYKGRGTDINFLENIAEYELKDGTTLLHIAMKLQKHNKNSIQCIEDLIKGGADLVAKLRKGRRLFPEKKRARLMWQSFSDVDEREDSDETPLHLWAMSTYKKGDDVVAIAKLLNNIPVPDVEDLKNVVGSTPLHILTSKGLLNSEKFKVLADWGIPLDEKNNYGRTVLHNLSLSGPDDHHKNKEKILQFLLGRDISSFINAQDKNRKTALHNAVQEGDELVFNFLSNHPDIDFEKQDNTGNTALHIAAQNVRKRNKHASYFIKQLLARGAKKNVENYDNKIPQDLVPDLAVEQIRKLAIN